MKTWIWRISLVLVVMFLGLGLYRFIGTIPDLLNTNLKKSSPGWDLQVQLLDSLEGLLSARIELQPFRVFPDLLEFSPDYPLTLNVCLYSLVSDAERLSLRCWDRQFQSITEWDPTSEFEDSFYLPSGVQQFRFQSEVVLKSGEHILFSELSQVREFAWVPEARLRLVSGQQLPPGEKIRGQQVVFLVSRSADIQFLYNGEAVTPSLVVKPVQKEVFSPSDEPPSLFQWVFPVPQEQSSAQLCLQSGATQCYVFETAEVSIRKTSCGNGTVEAGEECDDGNGDDQDSCTSQCVNNVFRTGQYSYPQPRFSLQQFDETSYSVFARLDETMWIGEGTHAEPLQLLIRFVPEGGTSTVSTDGNRLSGFPFLYFTIPAGTLGALEYVHLRNQGEYVFHSTLIDTTAPEPLMSELQSAADVPEQIGGGSSVPILNVKWLGSETTEVRDTQQEVIDHSGTGDFQTRIVVQSTFPDPVKIFLQFVDESISFTHTLPAGSLEEIPVAIPQLAYGDHRMVVYAVFPDGQKSADIVLPFHYRSDSVVSSVSAWLGMEWWQVGAIFILVLLGFSYVMFRVMFLRSGAISNV